jgi:hypothetical protein
VARAFGVSEEALKTRRAEIMATGQSERFAAQEASRVRAEERAESRRQAERVRERGGLPLDVDPRVLSDYREKRTGIAMARGSLDEAHEIMTRYPDEAPGIGGVLGRLDDAALSSTRHVLEPLYGDQYMADAIALRRIRNAVLEGHAIGTSGTSFTQAQVSALKASLGLETTQDAADFRSGLERAAHELDRLTGEVERGAPPAVVDYFGTQRARTGRFSGDDRAREAAHQPARGGEGSAPAQEGGGARQGRVQLPSGRVVTVSDVAEAVRRGATEVR